MPGRERRPGPCRGRRGTLAQQEARAGIALLSPTLIVVLVMVVLPILWTIVIAFQSLRLRNLRTRLFDFQFTLDNFEHGADLARVPGGPQGHPDLQRRRDLPVDRPGAGRRPGGAQAVQGPHPRAGVDAAALCGPGGGGHLRLADHAQPRARHRERHRHRPARLGGAHPVPGAADGHHQHLRPRPGGAAGPDRGHPLPGLALLPVLVPVHPGPAPGPARRARRGRPGRRGHPPAAVLAHHPAPAPGRHRPADGAPVHLDLQRVRRHLPAHPGRRRHRGGLGAGVPLPHRPRRHRRRRRPLAGAGPAAGGAAVPLLPLLRQPGEEAKAI